MTTLASHLSTFLREYLPRDRAASTHTCEAYSYSLMLLLRFASERLRVTPSQIDLAQVDASLVLAFLTDIEKGRGNTARTRNARLAAIKSFFRYLEYREPLHIEQGRQIHGIPLKKTDEGLVAYLTRQEIQALLDAPDASTAFGLRDRAMLHVAYACGLRVAELVSLRLDQLDGRAPASIRVMGKGRRERVLPLWKETNAALNAWLQVRQANCTPELFHNTGGRAMTRAGFEYILDKHVGSAADKQPSIVKKNRYASRASPQLRDAHSPGHRRHQESVAMAGPREHPEHGNLPSGRSNREARCACDGDTADSQAGQVQSARQTPGNVQGGWQRRVIM